MARLKTNKKESHVNSIGEKLKMAREEKRISLEDAHKATKIHPNVLQGLEEDRLEDVLGKTYVRAFLKKYAHYLGLNEKEVLDEYASKRTPESSESPILAHKTITEPRRKRKFTSTIIITSSILIWVLILCVAATKFISRTRGVAAKQKEVIVADAYATDKKKGSPEVVAEKGLIPIPKSRTLTLTVIANKEVWMKVMRDGELTFHGILPNNSKETWQADKEIMLSEIGRPEALTLNVNGKDIDFSERPLKKQVLITHEGIDIEPKP